MSKRIVLILAVFSLYFLSGCASHARCAAYSDSASTKSVHAKTPGRG